MRNCSPAFEIDCVINFWDLAHYAGYNPKEYFYKLWPEENYKQCTKHGTYTIIDCYDKICYAGEDEVRKAWEDVKFYIEDCGYHFYDKVMFIF